MRNAKLAAMAALGAALTSMPPTARAEPADGFVFDAISAPSTVSYAGVVQSVRLGRDGESEVMTYRIEHRAPNMTARFFSAPASLRGDEVITKGKLAYAVDADRRRVVESDNDAADDEVAFDDNYILMRANYRAAMRGTESFDDRPVDVVALVNKFTHRSTMLLRIDDQTKIVLEKQTFASDGTLLSEIRFVNVRFGQDIPASDFNVPAGFAHVNGATWGSPNDDVQRVVAAAGFGARGPKFLPEGFSPVEAKVVTVKGVQTLHLLYSDGIRTVSLFENAHDSGLDMANLHPETTTIGTTTAQYAETGPTTLLTWTSSGLHFVLVGELRLEELQRIAASI